MSHGARRLRVLVIDDIFQGIGDEVLATRDLEAIQLDTYRYSGTKELFQLINWEDFLQFCADMADGASAESAAFPEMLVIDCHVQRDDPAPYVEPTLDARGLLYGAVQIARQVGMQPWRPFGFAVYSRDLPRFAKDGYAVTLFGIIRALGGALPDFTEDELVKDKISREMLEHPSVEAPSKAWMHALRDYRGRLMDAFMNLRCDPDIASFEAALTVLRGVAVGEARPTDDLSLRWLTNFGEDNVLVRSLFADYRRDGAWDVGALKSDALPWLDSVIEIDRSSVVVKPVQDWLRWYTSRKESRDLLFAKGTVPVGRGLALTALWAYLWSQKNDRSARTAAQLQKILGIDAVSSSRAVQQGLGL